MERPRPRISIIVALAENGVIGRDNRLPWHLPDDLKHFRRLTVGHPVIMGRRNYESLGRPLPDRLNIVVTRQAGYAAASGCRVVHSLEQAFAQADGAEEIFVIGGGDLYAQTLERADRLYLTRVHAGVDGDTRFPEFDVAAWHEIERVHHEADAHHAYAFSFVTLDRRRGP
ncbi:dihydrofolate reductase [Sulfurifustis variabilis]|uniref:Dihydrofolate reductase n=1 Tax=Sulfurifustis variabilis TaxID=1675686 RepID=A0A1B4V2V7_9GAMM|nr:type 3 dihydrofolate reductase [Sulfurifustis variabilis]BAU47868.1 dihydrofolate reductase [Sulfurifustis variabilis]